jgi:stress-induced morphogen
VQVFVESTVFAGKTLVAQHRMVTSVIKEEIKDVHAVSIHTAVPST